MREFIWRTIARIISRPRVAGYLIRHAQRTPYSDITSRDGADIYMQRWWLFNAYSKDENDDPGPPRRSWLPSIRVHHILRADSDDHLHDHPWNARTIVLRGWYKEERPTRALSDPEMMRARNIEYRCGDVRAVFWRAIGYTGRVMFGQYHRISEVPDGGVYTLWFTWKYRGTWGFDVDGVKVPYRVYLGLGPK